MKKVFALLLTLTLLAVLPFAQAANASPYDTLTALMDGHNWTFTAAVTDAELTEDAIPFTATSLSLILADDGAIEITGVIDGETVLSARMTEKDFTFECSLIGAESRTWTWAEEPSTASYSVKDGIQLNMRINSPQYDHLTISLDMDGEFPGSCTGEIGFTLMKGSGEIYGLWDVFSAEDGETTTEFILSLVHELSLTGEGAEETVTAENGAVTVTRVETCEVSQDGNEAGTVTLTRTVTVD